MEHEESHDWSKDLDWKEINQIAEMVHFRFDYWFPQSPWRCESLKTDRRRKEIFIHLLCVCIWYITSECGINERGEVDWSIPYVNVTELPEPVQEWYSKALKVEFPAYQEWMTFKPGAIKRSIEAAQGIQ